MRWFCDHNRFWSQVAVCSPGDSHANGISPGLFLDPLDLLLELHDLVSETLKLDATDISGPVGISGFGLQSTQANHHIVDGLKQHYQPPGTTVCRELRPLGIGVRWCVLEGDDLTDLPGRLFVRRLPRVKAQLCPHPP